MASVNVDAVMSRLNPLIVAILRTPVLHWLLSPGLMLVRVTGRRSGRRYRIPVGYQRDGDDLIVLVSRARKKQWWRNYREARKTEIRLRGRDRQGEAVVIAPGSAEFDHQIERSLARMPRMASVFGVERYDKRSGLTASQLEHLAREIAIVRIAVDKVRDSLRPLNPSES